jgi:hypothetical protein
MRPATVFITAVLVATSLTTPRLRGAQREVTERHVYVSVRDAKGALPKELTARDFVVREDDVAREVIGVSPAPPPSHLVILVDNSNELQPALIELRASLRSFVQGMHALPTPPSMMLMTIAERPTVAVTFTTSDIAMDSAIQKIFQRPGAGSYLLDGIVEACQTLRKAKAERPTIAAFTIETTPEFSNLLHTKVADALKDAHASLWTIELAQQSVPAVSQDARERARVVNEVTLWSGGGTKRTLSKQGLAGAFADTAAAMAARYDVTYGRPASTVPPSKLVVETRDRSLRVTAPRWTGQ